MVLLTGDVRSESNDVPRRKLTEENYVIGGLGRVAASVHIRRLAGDEQE